MALAEWVTVFAGVLVAVAGGSWIGDWLAARTKRKLDIQIAHVEDVQRAAEALVDFALLVSRRNSSGDPSLDNELRRSGNSLEAATAMVRDHDLGDRVRTYVSVGEAFAAGDPEVSETTERTNFRAILEALRQARHTAPKRR